MYGRSRISARKSLSFAQVLRLRNLSLRAAFLFASRQWKFSLKLLTQRTTTVSRGNRKRCWCTWKITRWEIGDLWLAHAWTDQTGLQFYRDSLPLLLLASTASSLSLVRKSVNHERSMWTYQNWSLNHNVHLTGWEHCQIIFLEFFCRFFLAAAGMSTHQQVTSFKPVLFSFKNAYRFLPLSVLLTCSHH